jgi:Cof subfamily protein (haloacid dehalogenase superfamily)
MEKYLISVDLDDTLLTSEKEITSKTKEYIRNLVNKGHYFIINTGRPHQGTKRFVETLNINMPIIVNNGGAIVFYDQDNQKITSYHIFPMNVNKLKKLISKTKHMMYSGSVTSLYKFYSNDFSKLPFWIMHKSEDVEFVEGDIIEKLDTVPHISEFCIKEEYEEQFDKIIAQKQFNGFSITKWGHFDNVVSYEISSKKASKGNAMEYLCKKYNIKKENTMSFGDQLNDISMIEKAKYGVAMINARDQVKEKAKYISEFDFNNNGVIEFIKRIIG